MPMHLRFELKEETGDDYPESIRETDTQPPLEQMQPIMVELISKVTLGRGEDKGQTTGSLGADQSSVDFEQEMKRLSNPHIDLSPFYAHERGVSRKHARIALSNIRLTVTDLGSTNGTYVNNQKLEPNVEYSIKAGDDLRLGFLTLTLTVI